MAFNDRDSNLTVGGKYLYNRIHGVRATVAAGASHTLTYTVTYDECLFLGVEVVCMVTCVTDLKIYAPDGTTLLGQFGWDVNVGMHVYERLSSYPATIVKDIILKCTVTNIKSISEEIGVNFILHEVKDE